MEQSQKDLEQIAEDRDLTCTDLVGKMSRAMKKARAELATVETIRPMDIAELMNTAGPVTTVGPVTESGPGPKRKRSKLESP